MKPKIQFIIMKIFMKTVKKKKICPKSPRLKVFFFFFGGGGGGWEPSCHSGM